MALMPDQLREAEAYAETLFEFAKGLPMDDSKDATTLVYGMRIALDRLRSRTYMFRGKRLFFSDDVSENTIKRISDADPFAGVSAIKRG